MIAKANGPENKQERTNEITELYRKHRPTKFKEVRGQDAAVKTLTTMLQDNSVPHAILFTGPSGTGKTTLARILKNKLGCGDADFVEINAADSRGVDTIREIKVRMTGAPISGSCRIWLLDECHALTPDAQSALLKILEDVPKHVYFMLATTDPRKLKTTIHTRCTEVKLAPLGQDTLEGLLREVAEKEGVEVSDALVERVGESSDGSGRKALVLLNQVMGLKTEEERLDAVVKTDTKRQAIELCRVLMDPRKKWGDAAAILKGLDDEDPEQVRRLVLSYATSVILGAGQKMNPTAYHVLVSFEGDFFQSGRAGLVRASFEVMERRG